MTECKHERLKIIYGGLFGGSPMQIQCLNCKKIWTKAGYFVLGVKECVRKKQKD